MTIAPPGPDLHAVLAAADRSRLSDDDLVLLVQARARLIAGLQADLLADVRAVGRRAEAAVGAPARRGEAGLAGQAEVAMALTWTEYAAGHQLALADDLIDRLPAVYAALRDGDIDLAKARIFSDLLQPLPTALARQVADQVVGVAHRLTTGQLKARLRKLVLTADPDAFAKAAKTRLVGRRVMSYPSEDGLGEIHAVDLPAERTAAAMERLTAIARAAKAGGDLRKIDQLRADALLDLLVGDGVAVGAPVTNPDRDPDPDPDPAGAAAAGAEGADGADGKAAAGMAQPRAALPAPRRGVIELQVPLTTLMGLADLPGDLHGWGPVVADIARQIVARGGEHATWRYSVYDDNGELAAHGTTRRRPTTQAMAFIRARDRTCRAPGCRAAARRCDIDHTHDWARGGTTSICNLACLCRKHHLLKHLPKTQLTQLSPGGVLAWTTPLNQTYATIPEPWPDPWQEIWRGEWDVVP